MIDVKIITGNISTFETLIIKTTLILQISPLEFGNDLQHPNLLKQGHIYRQHISVSFNEKKSAHSCTKSQM